jgi:CheY-like chemotaxis protein
MTKLMLVEDDNNLREIYGARLAAEGYEIVSAKDGEEALALAVKEKPDLIISDVMMPKISGFDMLDILRSTPETKSTKVIMMTALSQKEDQERGEKLGADRYLVKSQVTLEDVVRVVSEVLAEIGIGTSPTTGPPSTDDSSSDDASSDDDTSSDEPAAEETTPEPESTPPEVEPPVEEPTPDEKPAEEAPAETPEEQPAPDEKPAEEAPETDVRVAEEEPAPETPEESVPPPDLESSNESEEASEDEKKNDLNQPSAESTDNNDIPKRRAAKVIAPISSPGSKPDINELLAREEANAGTPGTTLQAAAPVSSEAPSTLSASEEQSEVEEQIADFVTSAPDGPPPQVEPQEDPPEATNPQPAESPDVPAPEPLIPSPEPEPEVVQPKDEVNKVTEVQTKSKLTKDGVDPNDIAL